ncbi:hypothetical protein BP6252_03003 [Coleophoma cylindrospora]|uniref:Nap family protein n=1 Tax=Coleophoma cylindrospora TaxID=1849047 RepID=A0A3D8S739_9HELO|nr:hypothetical protein BP6252_03003 [Coleophoma cylindrospora]
MPQKFAFTTAAMAAALEDTPITYEDLAEIEKDFDDADTEIIKQQVALTAPLYARRAKTVSQIPNFWPLVLEQAPPDIDQFIQPSDSALLLSSLTALNVTHFELAQEPQGDPRSISIQWTFAENEYFEDTRLEKKFWHRRGKDGWSGLVSEPVQIKWKKGKDLTGGLLDLVCQAWEAETRAETSTSMSPEQKALRKKIENTGMGGLSFFAWFGYIGRKISKTESDLAKSREAERRTLMKSGLEVQESIVEEEDAGDEDEEVGMSLEIFPDGDDLAVAITEDLWPGAIRYFTQAQEQDALSDADFESDDEGMDDGSDAGDSADEAERPAKKPKTS